MGTVLLVEWPRSLSWHDKLEAWLPICAAAEGVAEETECLRFIARHLEDAPSLVRAFVGRPPEPSEFETLLRIGAVESAAARLTADVSAGILCSRSATGRTLCTVAIPGAMEEVTFEGRSETLARVGAIMKAIVELLANAPSTSVERKRPTH